MKKISRLMLVAWSIACVACGTDASISSQDEVLIPGKTCISLAEASSSPLGAWKVDADNSCGVIGIAAPHQQIAQLSVSISGWADTSDHLFLMTGQVLSGGGTATLSTFTNGGSRFVSQDVATLNQNDALTLSNRVHAADAENGLILELVLDSSANNGSPYRISIDGLTETTP